MPPRLPSTNWCAHGRRANVGLPASESFMRPALPLFLALGLMLAGSPSLMAESPAVGSATNWFKSHDRDNDGYLVADEVIGYELKLMKRADKNGDGKLSLREFI